MRAVIYARVSLDVAEGRSVSEQETECRAWADREGWDVTHVITETGSASRYAKTTRARWTDVTTAIASGNYDILLTWEASRATRQLDEYTQLRALCAKHGVLWGYSGQVYDLRDRTDRFRTGLDMLTSEDESARTSERIQRSVRARARQGQPHGKIPYGYRREYDTTTGRPLRQVPDETTAPVVREIYARILDGDGIRTIATDLDHRRIPTPRPPRKRHDRTQTWVHRTVRHLALSPTYAGLRTHKGVIVGDAAWPALVDRADWEKTVAILTNPARRTNHGDSLAKYLLGGIARCGLCRSELRMLKSRGQWRTYTCMQTGCFKISITAPRLDEHIRDVMVELLTVHGHQLQAAGQPSQAGPELDAARARLQELRDRLNAFVTEGVAGRLTPSTLARVEADLTPQIANAEKAVRHLLLPRAVHHLDLTDPATSWDQLNLDDRRQLLRDLVQITIHPADPEKHGQRGLDTGRVSIDPLW